MTVTDEGMEIVESDRQREKASAPSSNSCDPHPKVTIESRTQREKQRSLRVVTDDGMQIVVSEGHSSNAASSIRKSFEFASNAIPQT
jgi:hypothetical protein